MARRLEAAAIAVDPVDLLHLGGVADRVGGRGRHHLLGDAPRPPQRHDDGQAARRAAKQVAARPRLLAGGNPQIAKADGDAPVQAYIAAMPGWKRDVGRRLDAIIARTVPGVRKAVKWNSPLYGVEGQG